MKFWHIAWKDTSIRLRDWKAIIGFVVAPLVISFVVGAAFGGQLTGEVAISDIPVVLVNEDDGELGQVYVDVFNSDDLSDLFAPIEMDSFEDARQLVEAGEVRAVVHIPAGFSNAPLGTSLSPQSVELITDPASTITPFIIKSVVEQISAEINTLLISGEVGAEQVVAYADLLGPALAQINQAVAEVVAAQGETVNQRQIELEVVEVGEAERDINPFAYFGPSMAIFFLMFSMFDGTRSILQEETMGTLPRLISTPTPTSAILLGKMGGAFLTGILQFAVLVAASALLFDLNWGDSAAGLILMVLATVFAATSLGAFISSFAKDAAQAGILGSAVTLIFAALGGTFASPWGLPGFMQVLSKMTLNRWALDGFVELTFYGGGLADVLPHVGVLMAMAVVFFILGVALFRRRFVR